MRTPIEYCQPARARRSKMWLFQNPESARSSLGPLAPARVTRAMSSSTKRSAPRALLPEPFRSRTCSTSPVSAGGEDRVVTALAGVAEGGAPLGVAVDLA